MRQASNSTHRSDQTNRAFSVGESDRAFFHFKNTLLKTVEFNHGNSVQTGQGLSIGAGRLTDIKTPEDLQNHIDHVFTSAFKNTRKALKEIDTKEYMTGWEGSRLSYAIDMEKSMLLETNEAIQSRIIELLSENENEHFGKTLSTMYENFKKMMDGMIQHLEESVINRFERYSYVGFEFFRDTLEFLELLELPSQHVTISRDNIQALCDKFQYELNAAIQEQKLIFNMVDAYRNTDNTTIEKIADGLGDSIKNAFRITEPTPEEQQDTITHEDNANEREAWMSYIDDMIVLEATEVTMELVSRRFPMIDGLNEVIEAIEKEKLFCTKRLTAYGVRIITK